MNEETAIEGNIDRTRRSERLQIPGGQIGRIGGVKLGDTAQQPVSPKREYIWNWREGDEWVGVKKTTITRGRKENRKDRHWKIQHGRKSYLP